MEQRERGEVVMRRHGEETRGHRGKRGWNCLLAPRVVSPHLWVNWVMD